MNKNSNVTINKETKNNNFGGIIMMNTSINTFAEEVKREVEVRLGENYEVIIREVVKNNDTHLTGLIISSRSVNISPTIYLESYYARYEKGEDLGCLVDEILDTYEKTKVKENFDIDSVIKYERCRDRICIKLVNADKNSELLEKAPYRLVCEDLAVLYTVLVSDDGSEQAVVTIRNRIFDKWNITEEELYGIALENTERLFRGKIESLASVVMQIISDKMDTDIAREFYDMCISDVDTIPIYVCSNVAKHHGASVILYDGVLKEFTDKVGCDCFILPSSIHETLLVPVSFDTDVRCLRDLVKEVNSAEVSPEEVLSDNVYRYYREEDVIRLA